MAALEQIRQYVPDPPEVDHIDPENKASLVFSNPPVVLNKEITMFARKLLDYLKRDKIE